MMIECTPEEFIDLLSRTRPTASRPQVTDAQAVITELQERNAAGAEALAVLQRNYEARCGDLHGARAQARLHEQRAAELNGEVGRLTGLLAEERARETRWPEADEVWLDENVPPHHIRVWCEKHPLSSDEQPIRGRRRLPTVMGGPGADIGDGLDVWRVDGSSVVNQLRRQALDAGVPQAEVNLIRAYTDVDYARLVQALEQIERSRAYVNPVAGLAELVGRTVDALRGPLRRAHEAGVATVPAKMGHPGGPQRLTEKGRALLSAADGPSEATSPEPDRQDPTP